MPVTIIKPATKAATQPKVEIEIDKMSDEQLADEYGSVKDHIDALANDPAFSRFKLLEAELKDRLKDLDPSDAAEIKGSKFLLEITACSKSPRKVVDVHKVMDFLGKETFFKIASVGISDAEKYLTPSQLEQVVPEVGYTKNRKVVAKYIG